MKKTFLIIISMVIVLGFAGCSSAGQNLGRFVEEVQDTREQSDPEAHKVDIVTCQNPSFGSWLGFDVTSYPNDTALYPHKYFVMDNWYGQVEFKDAEDHSFVLRVAYKSEEFLSSTYLGSYKKSDNKLDIDGTMVRIRTNENKETMYTWQNGNFQFLLHANHTQPTEEQLTRFVKGLSCTATSSVPKTSSSS